MQAQVNNEIFAMMTMQKALNAYGQAEETIPPAKQIVMLYDGVLRHIANARLAIVERRINDRYQATQKATMVIEALQGCLDFEQGGDIAPQLDQIYTYLIFRLQAINIDDDVAICDELMERVGELRESWAIIANNEADGQPGAAPPRSSGATSAEAIEA